MNTVPSRTYGSLAVVSKFKNTSYIDIVNFGMLFKVYPLISGIRMNYLKNIIKITTFNLREITLASDNVISLSVSR